MFADDASLNTSDKDTDTVQNELQRSINEASDCETIMPRFYICLLYTSDAADER